MKIFRIDEEGSWFKNTKIKCGECSDNYELHNKPIEPSDAEYDVVLYRHHTPLCKKCLEKLEGKIKDKLNENNKCYNCHPSSREECYNCD